LPRQSQAGHARAASRSRSRRAQGFVGTITESASAMGVRRARAGGKGLARASPDTVVASKGTHLEF